MLGVWGEGTLRASLSGTFFQTYTYRKDVVNQRLEFGVRGGRARLLERGAFPVGTLSKKRSGTTIHRFE